MLMSRKIIILSHDYNTLKVDKAFYTKEKLHCRVKKGTGKAQKYNQYALIQMRHEGCEMMDYRDVKIRKAE